jgi:hypothetical protein
VHSNICDAFAFFPVLSTVGVNQSMQLTYPGALCKGFLMADLADQIPVHGGLVLSKQVAGETPLALMRFMMEQLSCRT